MAVARFESLPIPFRSNDHKSNPSSTLLPKTAKNAVTAVFHTGVSALDMLLLYHILS